MTKYVIINFVVKVVISADATAGIEELPLRIRTRVLAMIPRLERWPKVSGAKPLRGALKGQYRVRTGNYRVQFHVTRDTLVIEKVGHRDGFYDE